MSKIGKKIFSLPKDSSIKIEGASLLFLVPKDHKKLI